MAKNGILAKIQELHPSFCTTTEQITSGIDPGDHFSHCRVLGPDGNILTEGRLRREQTKCERKRGDQLNRKKTTSTRTTTRLDTTRREWANCWRFQPNARGVPADRRRRLQ